MLNRTALVSTVALIAVAGALVIAQPSPFPSTPLRYGFFTMTFGADGTLDIVGKEAGSSMKGTWKVENDELVVTTAGGPRGGCEGTGRYKFQTTGTRVMFTAVSDTCVLRQMVLNATTFAHSAAGQ